VAVFKGCDLMKDLTILYAFCAVEFAADRKFFVQGVVSAFIHLLNQELNSLYRSMVHFNDVDKPNNVVSVQEREVLVPKGHARVDELYGPLRLETESRMALCQRSLHERFTETSAFNVLTHVTCLPQLFRTKALGCLLSKFRLIVGFISDSRPPAAANASKRFNVISRRATFRHCDRLHLNFEGRLRTTSLPSLPIIN
jgi:hypothetical protein